MVTETIQKVCAELGTYAPKVVEYGNAVMVAMRNGDGERVVALIDHNASRQEIEAKLTTLFKTKAEVGAMSTHDMLRRIEVPKPDVRHVQYYTGYDRLTEKTVKEPFTVEQLKVIDRMIEAKIKGQ